MWGGEWPKGGLTIGRRSCRRHWREEMVSEKVKAFAKRFAADESGLSAVEYGLLAAGIVLGITTFIGGIGTNLGLIFNELASDVSSAVPG